MARGRRPGRTRGGRQADDAAVAQPVGGVQEVVPLDFEEPERPGRARGGRGGGGGGRGGGRSGGGIGGTIGLVVPLTATFLAVILIVAGGFWLVSGARAAAETAADEAAVGSALALSAMPTDWWSTDHGLSESLVDAFKRIKDERIKKKQRESDDKRDIQLIENEFNEVMEKWDLKGDELAAQQDNEIRDANRERLENLVDPSKTPGTNIIWAAIMKKDNRSAYRYSSADKPTIREGSSHLYGDVQVVRILANGVPARYVIAPAHDVFGNEDGTAQVIVSTAGAARAASGLTSTVLIMTLLGLFLVGGITFGLCIGASKSLMKLAGDVEQIARGDLDVRIRVAGGGEVGRLGRAVDRAMKTFRAVQEQSIAAATAAPAAAPATVDTAVDTSTLLPSEPPRVDGYEFEFVHKPCMEGANDFFDFIQVDASHYGVVIADMPHPGPKGAFVASTFRALLRAYAAGETSPAKVLSRVNRVMAGELKRGDHISAMYTVLDTEKGIVTVASAGHLPLVFWKLEKKGSALLNPEGIAIGLDKGPVFEKTVVDKRIKLERGDRFVIYTDGPVAAVNADGEEFGEQRFYYLVNREAPKNSAAFVNFVANEVDLFHEGAPQRDDITIVTVRRVS